MYLDVNGDGRCTPGENPVPNIHIEFENGDSPITLYTGSDGAYGLVAVGLGQWRVTAVPNPSEWLVASPNPLSTEISSAAGMVQTDVNFCVVSLGTAVTLPATNAGANANIATLAVQSQALLTNPPPPAPTPTPAASSALGGIQPAPPPPAEDWLSYLNLFRDMGGLPSFQEMDSLSEGARSHACYMVVNDRPIAHNQDEANPLFSPAGRQAASHGNIFATSQIQAD